MYLAQLGLRLLRDKSSTASFPSPLPSAPSRTLLDPIFISIATQKGAVGTVEIARMQLSAEQL